MVKTWDDYLEECLSRSGKVCASQTLAFRVGMRMAFNFIKAEFPPAEVCRSSADLQEAVEASAQWFEAEDKHLGTFHGRMDMCQYAEWASRKALGQDVGEFAGVPRLIITRGD